VLLLDALVVLPLEPVLELALIVPLLELLELVAPVWPEEVAWAPLLLAACTLVWPVVVVPPPAPNKESPATPPHAAKATADAPRHEASTTKEKRPIRECYSRRTPSSTAVRA
jgi:hypothetical protein